MKRTAAFMIAALAVVALDQATKALVAGRMFLGQSIRLIDGCLSLTYIRNSGIAFGLLNDGAGRLKVTLLAVSTLAALAFIVWLLSGMERQDLFGGAAAGMVAGGAVGNLIDRLRFGEVIDFIDAYWRSHHWPAFNAADSAISVGVILLLAHQVITDMKKAPGREDAAHTH